MSKPNRKKNIYICTVTMIMFHTVLLKSSDSESPLPPQCVICHIILSNNATRPVRLKRHLIT